MRAQADAYRKRAMDAQTDPALSLKRFILERTAPFERTPEADLFRVNLLTQMLDRYDALLGSGGNPAVCVERVCHEFADIPRRMTEAGFEPMKEDDVRASGGWPVLTEEEAEHYMAQVHDYAQKRAASAGLYTACLAPLIALMGLFGNGASEDVLSALGLAGMFAMIGAGTYMAATAKKPKRQDDIKHGRFSLSGRLRKKLEGMQDAVLDRAKKRRAKGYVLLCCCLIPVFAGIALDSIFSANDVFSMVGVSGLFAMLGLGVYELNAAGGEVKWFNRLLK